jgi:hypothetical protein
MNRSVPLPGSNALLNTHLFHDRQNPGLVAVVPVGTHTNVDLLGERIGLVGSRELEDAASGDKYLVPSVISL